MALALLLADVHQADDRPLLLEEVLGTGPDPEVTRQAERQLHQTVIEERDARLDRGRHGDLVDPHEEQLGQAQREVQVDHPLEDVGVRPGAFELSELCPHHVVRGEGAAAQRTPEEGALLELPEGDEVSPEELLAQRRAVEVVQFLHAAEGPEAGRQALVDEGPQG